MDFSQYSNIKKGVTQVASFFYSLIFIEKITYKKTEINNYES